MTGPLSGSVPELAAGLYLVATPIGNLRDMTLRAIDVLGAVDFVLCEDTRITGKLLQAHGIKVQKLMVYSDHSADRTRPDILEKLAGGARIALVSDAGMPLVSDPGFKLVRDAQDQGVNVTSLPGANAVLTALQLSGLPTDKFSFLGFLPPKDKKRRDVLLDWVHVPSTLVVYETAPRLIDSLRAMADIFGAERMAAVTRELTKMFEESRRDTLGNLHAHYMEKGIPRGEIAIVIAPPEKTHYNDEVLERLLRQALQAHSVKDAVAAIAAQTGMPRKTLYDMALTLK